MGSDAAFVMTVPANGQITFLVFGQCECGWWCACHEGSHWPKCPLCGEQVLPPTATGRRAFLAHLGPETEIVEQVRRVGEALA